MAMYSHPKMGRKLLTYAEYVGARGPPITSTCPPYNLHLTPL